MSTTAKSTSPVSGDYSGESGIVGVAVPPANARIASLDGLRGFAILIVVMHNAGLVVGTRAGIGLSIWGLIANAGWVGVQLFFVLSGFLITRILLDSKGAPGWIRRFYIRRVLRIFPIYYFLLAFAFFVAPHIPAIADLGAGKTRGAVWYWTYLSNWIAPPYSSGALGMTHLWSLAVEEQFYLLWPAVVALFAPRALAVTCVVMAVGAAVARLIAHLVLPPEYAATVGYFFTFARCDAIALGALVALLLRTPAATARLWSAFVPALAATSLALLAVVGIGRGMSPEIPLSEIVVQPLTAVLSALVVFACVAPSVGEGRALRVQSLAMRWLSMPWLVRVGEYSYAIYVFHYPVHRMLWPHFMDWLTNGSNAGRVGAHAGYTALVFVLSFVLARISWSVLEQPILSLKRYFPMPIAARANR